AERGGGGELFTSGAASIEGRMPINTHGGMLSFAQAGGSGGIHAIIESVRQLRGNLGERQVKKHETVLVHNEGGILSSHCTMVFANQRR
ncbi:MAG: thiolase family protein, partial [Rhodospirillales bacterium]|nr:thiolase family protein [Rhodospirillales bacterium]